MNTIELLEAIQESATKTGGDLGTALRQCKILATRLGSEPLQEWLVWESNGYPEDVDVPGYRQWRLELKGHFAGPWQTMMQNMSIPTVAVSEEYRDRVSIYRCRQSVASIEALLSKNNTSNPRVSLGDLFMALGGNVVRDHNCVSAWGEFSPGHLVELLNAVQNRILDFSLAVWKELSRDDGSGSKGITLEPTKVTQIFHTVVHGGVVAVASSNMRIAPVVVSRDTASLVKALLAIGIEPSDIAELERAVKQDPEPMPLAKFLLAGVGEDSSVRSPA